MNKHGFFITFEGPDGSGKSTIIGMLYERLQKEHFPFKIVLTREPGGNKNIIAEDIRNLLLNKMTYNIDPHAEALLFAASRAQHIHDFIKPHLENGDLIICDRYIHSSLIYQGYARGLGIKNVWDINKFAIQNMLPDLTFVLMLTPEQGRQRIHDNDLREVNRLDKEKMSLHQKVYEGYRKLIDDNRKKTIIEIDATQSKEIVLNQIEKIVKNKIKKHYAL